MNTELIKRNYDMATKLVAAVKAGDLEKCKELIEAGADVNVEGQEWELPLHEAALAGNLEICKLLVEHGASVHSRNAFGASVLSNALFGSVEVCQWLLDSGLDPDAESADGLTPLCDVMDLINDDPEKCETMCKFLLEQGANPWIGERDKKTPWEFVRSTGNQRLIKLFTPYARNAERPKPVTVRGNQVLESDL